MKSKDMRLKRGIGKDGSTRKHVSSVYSWTLEISLLFPLRALIHISQTPWKSRPIGEAKGASIVQWVGGLMCNC